MAVELDAATIRDELARFGRVGRVFISLDDINSSADIPFEWRAFFAGPLEERISNLRRYWGAMADRLPSVLKFIDEKVMAPVILQEDTGDLSLLYPHSTEGGRVHFYQGYLPLGLVVSDEMPLWSALPDDLKIFYRDVHNGWTYLADNAMGPLPVSDMGLLSDHLDLAAEEMNAMPVDPEAVLPVLHNGSGDYLCLNLMKSQGDGWDAGLIWWHENPLALQAVDFWAYLNAWIEIFLEEVDSR